MGEGSKGWMSNSHPVIKFFSSHLLVQSGSMSRCLACLLPLGWYICSCSRPTDKYTNEWRKCLFFLHTNGIHLATLEFSTHNISFWEHPKMINYASASSSSCWWWWWHPLRIDDLRMNFPGRCTTYMRLASTFDWNCTNDIVWFNSINGVAQMALSDQLIIWWLSDQVCNIALRASMTIEALGASTAMISSYLSPAKKWNG